MNHGHLFKMNLGHWFISLFL